MLLQSIHTGKYDSQSAVCRVAYMCEMQATHPSENGHDGRQRRKASPVADRRRHG